MICEQQDVLHAILPDVHSLLRFVFSGGLDSYLMRNSTEKCVMRDLFCLFIYCEHVRYIDQFSRCLYVEYKGKGIDVQCQVLLCYSTSRTQIHLQVNFFAMLVALSVL